LDDQTSTDIIRDRRKASGWQGLYFGGVAFKYQRPVHDLARAAGLASKYMDVITTSGPGTGQASSRAKIRAMKEALGDFPLAIASGITPANVHDYLDVADCFLVATGISKSFTELDSTLVKRLAHAIKSHDAVHAGETNRVKGLFQRSGQVNSVCFVCEWNEGRSAHLELSTRHRLKAKGSGVRVTSAGLRQGGHINRLRGDFLANVDISRKK
jgi:hypothetical protein